jgi:hypothetical protein
MHHAPRRTRILTFGLEEKPVESPLGAAFVVNSEPPHQGTSLGPFVCGASEAVQEELNMAIIKIA